MTENDRILIGRKNSFIQSVSRMVSKAGGCMGRCLRAEFFYFLDGMCLVQMCSRIFQKNPFIKYFRQVPFQESFLLKCLYSFIKSPKLTESGKFSADYESPLSLSTSFNRKNVYVRKG